MDISHTYVQEPSMNNSPIYVRALPNIQGTHITMDKCDKLLKNLWGGRYAGHYYITAMLALLHCKGYCQSDADRFILSKHESSDRTLISVTVDDFLVVASNASVIDSFHTALTANFSVKRLGRPKWFLDGRSLTLHTSPSSVVNLPWYARPLEMPTQWPWMNGRPPTDTAKNWVLPWPMTSTSHLKSLTHGN